MPENFADRLMDAIDSVQNPSCIGLDVRVQDLPASIKKKNLDAYNVFSLKGKERRQALFRATEDAIVEFNEGIIDHTHDVVRVYKPNIAFYERFGSVGVRALGRTIDHARSKGCLTITDAKRNDIGETAEAYSDGHLGAVELLDGSVTNSDINTDAMTVTAYIGTDTIKPFLADAKKFGKGVIILAKTSNPSSGELQDLWLDKFHGGRQVFEEMALRIRIWGEELKGKRGYSSVASVVGATYPEQAKVARMIMERNYVLVPAYGTGQGAKAVHCMPNFNSDGYGAVINNSRGTNFAYKEPEYRGLGEAKYGEAAREAALKMKDDIHIEMKKRRIFPW